MLLSISIKSNTSTQFELLSYPCLYASPPFTTTKTVHECADKFNDSKVSDVSVCETNRGT